MVRILEEAEYRHELKWKLLEECRESTAATSCEQFIDELIDILEAVEANAKVNGVDFASYVASSYRNGNRTALSISVCFSSELRRDREIASFVYTIV